MKYFVLITYTIMQHNQGKNKPKKLKQAKITGFMSTYH